MQRPRTFFDLDHTLYDTDAMLAPIKEDLVRLGSTEAAVRAAIHDVGRDGFSFASSLERLGHSGELLRQKELEYRQRLAEGNTFLFPGVTEAVARLAEHADCILVTYGYPPYQQEKFSSVSQLHPMFERRHFVWIGETKGDVIAAYGNDAPSFFIDDSIDHLTDVRAKAPWVRTVRMGWPSEGRPAHASDGLEWTVASSFEDVERLIRAELERSKGSESSHG